MVTVRLDMKKDCFFAEFSNLGVGNVPIADEYPEKFDRLLCGGIWCIVQLDYEVEGDNNFGIEDIDGNPLRSKQKKQKDISPISIRKLTPIQMGHSDAQITMNVYNHIAEKSHVENEMSKMNLPETVPAVV